MRYTLSALIAGGFIATVVSPSNVSARQGQPVAVSRAAPRAVLDQYCIACHNARLRTGGLELETVDLANPAASAELLERVIAKLRAGSMPPAGRPRPDAATYHAVATALEREIDRAWE